MTQTRLEETRNAYLAEVERNRRIKELEAELKDSYANIKKMLLKTLNAMMSDIRGMNYSGIDTDTEYTSQWVTTQSVKK
jgi:hypothetical protein